MRIPESRMLQQRLQRAVDAVIRTSRHTRGPEALAACASAEHELAMLQELVHSMKLDHARTAEHSVRANNDRQSFDRISIH